MIHRTLICFLPISPPENQEKMQHRSSMKWIITTMTVFWVCGCVAADEFNLVQQFHPQETPGQFQADGILREATIRDQNSHAVPVNVHNQGNVEARVEGRKEVKKGRRTAFKPDSNGNGHRLSVIGGKGGTVTSYVIYKFRAPNGEVFSGSFNVDARMAAWKLFNNSNSSVRIEYKFGHSWYWREIVEVSAPNDTSKPRLANKLDTIKTDRTLQFNASGHRTVYVRLVLHSSFFPDNAQVYRAVFRGRTTNAGDVQVLAGNKTSSSHLNTSYDLLKNRNRWGTRKHPDQVQLSWTNNDMSLSSTNTTTEVFYRRRVPVREGRVSLTLDFEGDPSLSTRAIYFTASRPRPDGDSMFSPQKKSRSA